MLRELLLRAVRFWRTGQLAFGTVSWHAFCRECHKAGAPPEAEYADVSLAIAVGDHLRAADVVEYVLLPRVACPL